MTPGINIPNTSYIDSFVEIDESIIKLLPRSSSRWRLSFHEKSVGICICYRSPVRGFSHCLIEVERQRRSPRLHMQSVRSAIFLPKYRAESKIITYPRASTVAQLLTSIGNFARISNNQESARINAFLCIFTTSRSAKPQTGASARRSATAKLAIIFEILSLLC